MKADRNQGTTIEVEEGDFRQQVLACELPVLVEFWTPWSRPCQVMDSVLKEVAATCDGKIKLVRVNADDSLDLSLCYDIYSVPTLLYFRGGKPLVRIVGTASKEAILAKLEEPNVPCPTAKGNQNYVDDSSPAGRLPRYSAKRNLHYAKFYCHAPQARQVCVVGDFNAWDPKASPMTRQPDGRWMVSLELGHGYHQYLFLVDGRPVLDPNATGKARNERKEPVSLLGVS